MLQQADHDNIVEEHHKIVGASSLLSELCVRFRRHGVYATVKNGLEYLLKSKDPFDKIYHTDTGGIEPPWKLTCNVLK